MNVKQITTVALVGMSISGAAHAQSWERRDADRYNPFPVVATKGSNNAYFEFACSGEREKEVARWGAQMTSAHSENVRGGSIVGLAHA